MSKAVMDHKCKSCGAELKFNPHGQNWKCDYCKSEFTKQEIDEYEASRGVEQLDSDASAVKVEKVDGIDEYVCNNCGARIVADEHTSATFCVYCKNTAIIKNKLVGEFNPTKVIPFYKTKDDAVVAFKGLKKGRPFMPKEFSDKKNIDEIRGIYIPFWLYDYQIGGTLEARATRVKSWTSGNTRYTKTDVYRCVRGGTMRFIKIPVDGSTRFNNDIMNSIEPFDYSKLVDFSHSYLSGFLAEKYDVDATQANNEAMMRAKNSTDDVLKKDIKGYSTVVRTSSSHNIAQAMNEYVLLPVYMLNIKYNNKMYTFAMNGQSGEIVGDIPIDKKKALMFFFGIFIGTIVILSLIWFIGGKM